MGNWMNVSDFINERPDGDLVMLCNEIYDSHETGILDQDSLLSRIFRDSNVKSEDIEDIILNISAERLEKVVLLLLRKRPYKFLKNIPNK